MRFYYVISSTKKYLGCFNTEKSAIALADKREKGTFVQTNMHCIYTKRS